MRIRVVHRSAAAFLMLQFVACSAAGDDPEPWRAKEETAARVAAGERLFGGYCSSCHGMDARGNGPVAPALRTHPADLTRIAERAGGTFDAAKVAAFIDGRTRIDAHGEREMPVWGRLYDDRNQNIMTDETLLSPGMIFDIVEYLRTIQAAEPAKPG
jgi:mono/diheme cytochrome c family protein